MACWLNTVKSFLPIQNGQVLSRKVKYRGKKPFSVILIHSIRLLCFGFGLFGIFRDLDFILTLYLSSLLLPERRLW